MSLERQPLLAGRTELFVMHRDVSCVPILRRLLDVSRYGTEGVVFKSVVEDALVLLGFCGWSFLRQRCSSNTMEFCCGQIYMYRDLVIMGK